jgi:peptide/nickel transport system substrate-binding protein
MKVLIRLLFAALFATGLGAPAFAETPGDTLVMAKQIDDIITLDPAEVFEFSGGEVIANVYDRIMMYEPEDTEKLVGGVAESWTVSDDGKTITFKIRSGLTFHSGRAITAGDAAFSLQRVIKLDLTPAFILTQFGWTKDNVDSMVVAVDDSTLQVTTAQQYATTFLLNCFSAGVASVVDREEVMAHEANGDLGHEWLKSNSAGSGAYKLVAWKANDSVLLEAHEGYRHGAPAMKRIVIRHVAEPAAQRLQLEKGDIDIARNLGPDQVVALEANADIAVGTYPKADVYYLGLSQKYEPLTQPQVRKAIRYLVDYQGMVDTFLKGSFKVHQAFWPSGFFASYTETPYSLDVEKAKALLAEAGYPDGFDLQFDCINLSPQQDICQNLQSTMGQAGIRVEILPGDSKQVITKYRARNHQMVSLYWSPDYMDPHSNADTFARNPDNSDEAQSKPLAWRNSWDIPELTAKADAAVLERDADARAAMYIEMQKQIQDDSPFVIMFQSTEQAALRANVKNFVSGPTFDTVFYRNISKS